MIKKILFFVLMFMFIYVTTFNIFMSEIFRIPAPVIFLMPLMVFYKYEDVSFEYGYPIFLFFIATFFYTLIAEQDIASFFAFLIKISCLILFFNYVIATSIQRFNLVIYIFYTLLFISGIVMLIDHQYDIANIRSLLVSGQVKQSPSGISLTIFTFGYQMAALTSFLLPFLILYKKNWLLSLIILIMGISFIFFGMQRSVLVAFALPSFIFIVVHYKTKSILIFFVLTGLLFIGQNYSHQFSSEKNQQNILNKSVKHKNNNEDRGDLMTENLKIISEYPFGLIFYNKSWNDVARNNPVYKEGSVVITSHNAYLMFITYLGPLIGFFMLFILYWRHGKIIWNSFVNYENKNQNLLFPLCCSFIAVSVNSLFHNDWLLTANGPTIILYISILHLIKINSYQTFIKTVD